MFSVSLCHRTESGVIESAHEPGPNRMKRQRLAMITIERPRCPSCGGVKLHKYRTLANQGDGSALWWVRCACGNRFRVLLEMTRLAMS